MRKLSRLDKNYETFFYQTIDFKEGVGLLCPV